MRTHNIPEVFKSEDTVYHYCDLNTAVEHILDKKQLRLSHRKQANDPIESVAPFFFYSSGRFKSESKRAVTKRSKLNEIVRKNALNKIDNAKQICFCKNDPSKKASSYDIYPQEEYYGFLKPRMWDQYADKFRGVCLAFSLEKLQQEATAFINGPVEYLEYGRLELNNHCIDEVYIDNLGVDNYWEAYSKRIEQSMFRKHKDYEGENEYRFLSFTESNFDFVNIERCLTGIVVSETYTSDFMKRALNKFADEFNIELLNIKWDVTGIRISTKKEKDQLYNLMAEQIKNQTDSGSLLSQLS